MMKHMDNNLTKKIQDGWVYLPVLVCIAIMLPRLVSPQFGLLDDGVTLTASRMIAQGQWSLGSEAPIRFRPAYWLYYGIIFILVGQDPLAFFLGNLIILSATTILLIYLVRRVGGTRLQAFFAGLLFTLAGPVFENYYTLSKSELLQVFGLLLSILAACQFAVEVQWWRKIIAFLGVILSLLLVLLTKETSLAILPISLAWVILATLFRPLQPGKRAMAGRLAYLAANVVALLAYLLIRAKISTTGLLSKKTSGFYSFDYSHMADNVVHWFINLQRDVLILAPLGLFLVVYIFSRKLLPMSRFYIDALVWMATWAVIFIPYMFAFDYYILPFAVGYAVFAGLALGDLVRVLPSFRLPGKILGSACLLMTGLLFAITIPNNITNARLQLAIDGCDTELLMYLAKMIPQGGTLLVNLPDGTEYIYEIGLHMGLFYDRKDIKVNSFFQQDMLPDATTITPYVVIAPEIDNQPYSTVRLGTYSLLTAQWNQALEDAMGKSPDQVFARSFRRSNIDLISLVCPLLADSQVCSTLSPVIDNSPVSYRWMVYFHK